MSDKSAFVSDHNRTSPGLETHILKINDKFHSQKLRALYSAIYYDQRKKKLKYNQFTNLPATLLMQIGGRNYCKYLNELEQIGEIIRNPIYRVSNGNVKGFCKSFKLTCPHENTYLVYTEPRKVKLTTSQVKKVVDTPSGIYISKCYSKLLLANVDVGHLLPEDTKLSHRYLNALKKINSNQVSVSQKTPGGRVSHALLQLPGTLRWLAERKDGEPMVEWDIRKCFPNLLLFFSEDAEESKAYLEFLKTHPQFYYDIVPYDLNNKDAEDRVKGLFCKFVNGMRKNEFYRFYLAHFPKLTATILRHGKGLAMLLQCLESRLTSETLLQLCDKENLDNIPMFDGGFCPAKDIKKVIQLFDSVCFTILGRTLDIKITSVTKPQTSISCNNKNPSPSPLCNCYAFCTTSASGGKDTSNGVILNNDNILSSSVDNIKLNINIPPETKSIKVKLTVEDGVDLLKLDREGQKQYSVDMMKAEIAAHKARLAGQVSITATLATQTTSDAPQKPWIDYTKAEKAAYGKRQGIRKAAEKAYANPYIPTEKTKEERDKDIYENTIS